MKSSFIKTYPKSKTIPSLKAANRLPKSVLIQIQTDFSPKTDELLQSCTSDRHFLIGFLWKNKAFDWPRNCCLWPGLCSVQSRSSSSVTTVSWAVHRLSSSAVGSTINMELHRQWPELQKLHLTTGNWGFPPPLTRQRCWKRWRQGVCEYAALASSPGSPLVCSSPSWWRPQGVVLREIGNWDK